MNASCRILLIQNAPEKIHPLAPPSPVAAHHHFSEARSSQLAHGPVCGTVEINAAGGGGAGAHGVQHRDASCGALDSATSTVGLHQHQQQMQLQMQQRLLNASPHHMLQLDVVPHSSNSAGTQTEEDAHVQSHQQQGQLGQLGQVAVAANIECSQSQHNYDRDWALDDVVSQISSFRPCPQGSGSMTPFHDSIHNVLEHSESSSRGSAADLCAGSRQDLSASGISTDTGRENAMQLSSFSGKSEMILRIVIITHPFLLSAGSGEHKAPSISSGVSHAVANGLGGFVYKPHHQSSKRYSNSSIFLENRDILNDSPLCVGVATPLTYDYSTPPKIDYRQPDLGVDIRRYSDTKLEQEQETMLQRSNVDGGGDTVLDIELPSSPLSPPAAYASQQQQQLTLRRSFDKGVDEAVASAGNKSCNASTMDAQMDRSRLFFKSLPNLSSSCESLIKK